MDILEIETRTSEDQEDQFLKLGSLVLSGDLETSNLAIRALKDQFLNSSSRLKQLELYELLNTIVKRTEVSTYVNTTATYCLNILEIRFGPEPISFTLKFEEAFRAYPIINEQ